jgi:hypothetical protein
MICRLTSTELQLPEQGSVNQEAEMKQMEMSRKYNGNHDGM